MSQKRTASTIGGILMALSAICLAVYYNKYTSWSEFAMLTFFGLALIAISMFLPRRQLLPICGFLISGLTQTAYLLCVLQWKLHGGYSVNYLEYLLIPVGWIFALLFVVSRLTNNLAKLKKYAIKLWFVPPILLFIGFYLRVNNFWDFDFYRYYQLLLVAGQAVILYGITPEDEKKNSAAQNQAESEVYCNLGKHVLLLLCTCGIWEFIWIYRTTKNTNRAGEEYRDPTKKLLLCMFVPFYLIYWTYKTAQRIDRMSAAKGIYSDSASICLILAIFVPIVPPILMQDKLNKIVTAKVSVSAEPITNQTGFGTPEELVKYKSLLDDGVITQEEFDAKKKQLLGL